MCLRFQVRLIHVNSEQALRYSGKVYPDWGFHQNEVVCDKNIVQLDTVWNVEEHRYTKSKINSSSFIMIKKYHCIITSYTCLNVIDYVD